MNTYDEIKVLPATDGCKVKFQIHTQKAGGENTRCMYIIYININIYVYKIYMYRQYIVWIPGFTRGLETNFPMLDS